MAKIIAVANQKGGVAKSTSTQCIGHALARNKKRVLMVDLDAQSSLTILSGFHPAKLGDKNMSSIMDKEGADIRNIIVALKDNLHIACAHPDLSVSQIVMVGRTDREHILKRVLKVVDEYYDYILLDCPPDLGLMTQNALSCADYVIIPSMPTEMSLIGIELIKGSIAEAVAYTNPKLKEAGIIVTMLDVRDGTDVSCTEEIKKRYNVIGVVKARADVKKVKFGNCIIDTKPSCIVSREYFKIAELLMQLEG